MPGDGRRVVVWVQEFQDRDNLVLQWHDPGTGARKSRSAGTADPREAERARADLEYELNNGLHRGRGRLPWAEFRARFEAEYVAPLRRNTRRNYKQALDDFERLAKPARVDAVTERTVSLFLAALRKRPGRGGGPLLPSTLHLKMRFLHSALAWGADQKLLAAVPDFPAVKVPRRRPLPVPAEAFERLLGACEDREFRAFLLCGWLAGLRLTEAFVLERAETRAAPWLDPARRRVWFPAEFVKAVEDQWVPLDPGLGAALDALPRQGARVFRFAGRWHGVREAQKEVARLAARAGVRLTFKDLRKGFGCRHAQGVPAQVLQRLMRHADIKTTMAFYANVDAAVEEAILGKPAGKDAKAEKGYNMGPR